MGQQFIYQIQDLTKKHGQREVLKDIWLAFYPGAKIGVLGTQRRRQEHAAADHGRSGQGVRRRGPPDRRLFGGLRAAGAAAQSGQGRVGQRAGGGGADPSDCWIVSIRSIRSWASRWSRTRWKSCWPSRPACRTRSRPSTPGSWTGRWRSPWTRCSFRRAKPNVSTLSGGERRRVALCRMLLQKPDLLLLDEPTNHLDAESVAWLERHLAEYPGTVVAVTHDRYFLDNVAGWILELDRGRGIPWEGNYSSWLEQKKDRLLARGEDGIGPPEDAGAGAGMDSHVAAGTAGQEQGPHHRLREDGQRKIPGAGPGVRDSDSAGQEAGRAGRRGQGTDERLRRPPADRQPERSGCRPAASWASSVPTASARRRCSA